MQSMIKIEQCYMVKPKTIVRKRNRILYITFDEFCNEILINLRSRDITETKRRTMMQELTFVLPFLNNKQTRNRCKQTFKNF
jgi:hypothetical protein